MPMRERTFNRTSLELKRESTGDNAFASTNPFNRTSLELKLTWQRATC